ncbi:NUDIX domain-containing protein [Streptomyces lavendulae]|uniref:NUDIX domain-containing protein n=1 Tax=Streptomyces lavendulae TaxID=1914 RepID=UPI003322358B
MDVITWTGELACHLQAAHRMTREEFAERLGVHPQTVAGWHSKSAIVPRAEIQAALDTVYEKAAVPVRLRFARLSQPTAETAAQALRVAIAVVRRGSDVLLVQRLDDKGLPWQFPTGIVKPGGSPEAVAIRETHNETGVHCAVQQPLGERLHPNSGAYCHYFLAEHLAGEATNRDTAENAAVQWVPIASLTRFIPADRIYRPVLDALGVSAA